MVYHYTESGLENVFLENGVKMHDTPYGKGVSIMDTDGLHKAIGRWLVDTPKPLNGAELRFLRTEMELTQRDLAACIGTTEQTLRLWEKGRGKSIPGPADRLLRALYSEYAGGDGTVRRMVDRLAELDQLDTVKVCMRDTATGWQVDENAACA
jgi:putative transcriptional regulator